jgi:K(+)-stimulated pyrophosphate-energized sodium pump
VSFALLSPSALAAGLIGLAVAAFLAYSIRRQPEGSEVMRGIAALIRNGAMAFLRREYTVLIPFILIVGGVLVWAIGWRTGAAYVGGALCSVLAGLFGMGAATRANVRTAEAARAHGQARALGIAFNGGAVMGLAVASLGLLGIGAVVLVFAPAGGAAAVAGPWRSFSEIISGFAMGASSIALFARVICTARRRYLHQGRGRRRRSRRQSRSGHS